MPLYETVLIARNDLPANDMKSFIEYAKANQGKMQFGSSGVGSGSHLACARLNAAIGVEPTHPSLEALKSRPIVKHRIRATDADVKAFIDHHAVRGS